MGLDACVYCDCVEKGRLIKSHPYPDLLYIENDGFPCIDTSELEKDTAHEDWLSSYPCQHEECILIHRRIGNIGFISLVQESIEMFSKDPQVDFPIICNRVIYSGIHCGDFLIPKDVRKLDSELDRLSQNNLQWHIPQWFNHLPEVLYWKLINKKEVKKKVLSEFLCTMKELTMAALSINKPISF
jgi:hypothetical protein